MTMISSTPRNPPDDRVSVRRRSGSAEVLPASQGPKIIIHQSRRTGEVEILPPQSPRSQTSYESLSSHPDSLDLGDSNFLSANASAGLAPSSIKCFLHISFDGSAIIFAMNDLEIAYKESDSYEIIERIAQDHVKKSCFEVLVMRKLSFKYGNCTIIGSDVEKLGIPLTTREDWDNVCGMLTHLWTVNPRRALSIHIFRDYFSYRSPNGSEASFPGAQRLELQKLMKRAADGRKYIPHMALMRFTSAKNVREVIDHDCRLKLGPETKERFVVKVQEDARCLFALYVFAGLGMECLKRLLDIGYTDRNLPLEESDCCHPRCAADFDTLLDRQGGFIAARFDHIGEHQDFDSRTVIPIHFFPVDKDEIDFVKEGRRKVMGYERSYPYDSEKQNACCGSGSYSNVYRIRIDPDHHRLSRNRDKDFALKEFKDRPQRGDADFKQELRILNELRELSQKHIVTHRATWTQGGRYCILFPYAKCNLRQYMKWKSFDISTRTNVTWLLQQLRGLAQALKEIHNLSDPKALPSDSNLKINASGLRRAGYHHDLKPENILFFSTSDLRNGTFKVADFGSGKINTYRSGSIDTRSPNGTLTYEPPEAKSAGSTSRPYDIWSLGCVFLELLTWAVYDHQSVEEFARNRVDRRFPDSQTDIVVDDGFWQMAGDGKVTIRISVLNWIQDLRAKIRHQRQEPLRQVLELVICMLDLDQRTRITALHLWDTLDRIYMRKRIELGTDMDNSQGLTASLPALSTSSLNHRSNEMTYDGFVGAGYLNIDPMDTTVPCIPRRNSSVSTMSPLSRNPSVSSSRTSMQHQDGGMDVGQEHRIPGS